MWWLCKIQIYNKQELESITPWWRHRCPNILSKHGANSIGPNSMSSLPSPLRRWAWSLPIKISLLVYTAQNLPNTSKKLTLLHGILLKCIYKEICTIMYSCMKCLCKFALFWLELRLYIIRSFSHYMYYHITTLAKIVYRRFLHSIVYLIPTQNAKQF